MKKLLLVFAVVCALAQAMDSATGFNLPTLDEMAGDWLPYDNVANPPAVHNFHEMLLVDRSLTSVFFYPQDWLWRGGHFQRGYPPVTLTLDGHEYPATDCRWFAYRALRRNLNCGGLAVESDTRLINERRAVLVRVRVSNPGTTGREVALALSSPGTLHADGVSAGNKTQRKGVTTVTRPVQKPVSVATDEGKVRWEWKANLAPGGEQVLEYVASDEPNAPVAEWANDFAGQFDGFKKVWEQRWADAFTPSNEHFSGNLPVLVTDNRELARNYYMAHSRWLLLSARTSRYIHGCSRRTVSAHGHVLLLGCVASPTYVGSTRTSRDEGDVTAHSGAKCPRQRGHGHSDHERL